MKPTAQELALLRTRPQQVNAKLVIYRPPTVFACRVNDVDIAKAAISITYDTVSTGAYTDVKAGMTMYVGTSAGKADVGRVRVKIADGTTLSVAENGLDWADNLYLTVVNFYELWPKSSLDVQNGTNIIHYVDYDVSYSDQNQSMGTLLCVGPPGVCEAGESIYWGSSGTVQTEGVAIAYSWLFGGGLTTGSVASDPGYIQYDTPGYYMTEAHALITGTSHDDITYRPVIVVGGSVQPYTQWGFDSIDGSRDEGGWTAKLWLREENMPEVMDGSLCIIYQDCYYGSTKQNIGGNSPNRQKILFIGYIIDNSISYNWKSSKMEFAVSSPTGRMKLLEGLSVSMDNVASDPTGWQQVKNLTGKKALYYYLKWHTTILNCCDVHWMIDPDPEIPSWDSEISSVYDIVQKFADTYYLAEVVSDRQGAIWIEKHPKSIHSVTGTYNTVIDVDRQDWMGEIDITEQLSNPVSYLEMHGLGYAGIATGTVSDYLSAAPYINKRNPIGQADFIQGYVVSSQEENNQIVGDVFAHRNAVFPSVNVKLAGWYSLFDIAPEECVTLTVLRQDTARGVIWNKKSFMLREMSIERDATNKVLLPEINLYEVTQGTAGASVPIPTPVQPPIYPEFPPITGGWVDLPLPFDWPKPWVEPPPDGDPCRGNPAALGNGPYGLSFDKTLFRLNDTGTAYYPCYARMSGANNPTRVYLLGQLYGSTTWNDVTVQAVDANQNPVLSGVLITSSSYPGTSNSLAVYQFGSASGMEIAGFKITVTGGSPGYVLGDILQSGGIPLGWDGRTITGLVVGDWYAIESTLGPWYTPTVPPGGPPIAWWGSHLWQGAVGGQDWPGGANPAWVSKVEWAAYNHGRCYWQAGASSIKMTVAGDMLHPEDWVEHTGSWGYVLRAVNSCNVNISLAQLWNICA